MIKKAPKLKWKLLFVGTSINVIVWRFSLRSGKICVTNVILLDVFGLLFVGRGSLSVFLGYSFSCGIFCSHNFKPLKWYQSICLRALPGNGKESKRNDLRQLRKRKTKSNANQIKRRSRQFERTACSCSSFAPFYFECCSMSSSSEQWTSSEWKPF